MVAILNSQFFMGWAFLRELRGLGRGWQGIVGIHKISSNIGDVGDQRRVGRFLGGGRD